MRTRISDEEIEAMANTIQHSENVGTGFIMDDDAIKRVEEAIHIIGIGEGVEWSAKVMSKAVMLQAIRKGLAYYVAVRTKETIYSGMCVSEDAKTITFKDFKEELISVNKVDVVEAVIVNNMKELDYQLLGMQEDMNREEEKEDNKRMKQEPTKIILGVNDAKGFEIELVLTDEDGSECYAKKGFNERYRNSDEREQDSMIASISGEFSEILESIKQEEEALNDIDTKLFGLHSSLEYAVTLPYEQMYQEVKEAMKYINSIRADNRENTQSKLSELLAGQHEEFEYTENKSLLDDETISF